MCRGSGKDLEKMKEKHLTNHQHNLQLLVIEIYNAKNNISPEFIKDVFTENRSNYNLRSDNHLQFPKVITTRYGTENIMYRGYFLWSSLPKKF